MIRWKQAKIHMERRDAKDTMTILTWEVEAWDKIEEIITKASPTMHQDISAVMSQLDESIIKLRTTERDAKWGPIQPIEILFRPDITKELFSNNTVNTSNVEKARETIKKRRVEIENEMNKLHLEKQTKVTIEDLKEGFSKTIMQSSTKNPQTTTKLKTIQVINEPNANKLLKNEIADQEDELITDEWVDHFSFLSELSESFEFIVRHAHIATQEFSDQILAQAFRHAMKGKQLRMKQCVHQALILQYCALLGKDGIGLFFKRMQQSKNEKANEMFYKDVKDTTERIINRVKEIQQEEKQQEEQERLAGVARYNAALQPDGSLKLPVLQEGDEDRAQVFARLPRELQEGLLKSDVDLINNGINSLDSTLANELMDECARVGLIQMEQE